jgi:hypothetical protein
MDSLPGCPTKHFCIGDEISVYGCGQFNGNLDRLFVSEWTQLKFSHGLSPMPYGANTRSRVTITRTGNPGRIVSVG